MNQAVLVVLGINSLLTLLALCATWRLVRLGQTWAAWADVLDHWNRQLPRTLRRERLLETRLQIAQIRWHHARLQLWQRRWQQAQRLIGVLWLVYRFGQRWGGLGGSQKASRPKARKRRRLR